MSAYDTDRATPVRTGKPKTSCIIEAKDSLASQRRCEAYRCTCVADAVEGINSINHSSLPLSPNHLKALRAGTTKRGNKRVSKAMASQPGKSGVRAAGIEWTAMQVITGMPGLLGRGFHQHAPWHKHTHTQAKTHNAPEIHPDRVLGEPE